VEDEKALLARVELWSIVPHHVLTAGKPNFGCLCLVATFMHLIDLDLAYAPIRVH
jgi:hypothetical protein